MMLLGSDASGEVMTATSETSCKPTTARPASRKRRARVCAAGALMLLATAFGAAFAEDPAISGQRAAEKRTFTDAQIIDGFFKVTFGAEFRTAGAGDRIRKYDGPVRVYIELRGEPDRSDQLAGVITDIGRHIQHLDIAVTRDRDAANVIVTLVRDRDLAKTIRNFYGNARARRIQHSLAPQCLSGFRKDESFRIMGSEVILVVDAGDFIFLDCAYEEMLQALGPINDDSSIPWTMFNDDVQLGFFDIYDQYLMNILYDRRIQPGMTREEVRAVLPQILPDVRSFVARVNNLPP